MRTKSVATVLLLALVPILTACQATGGGATKSALCDQFRPIRWSVSDTAETVRQSKEHNSVGRALCNWRPE